MTSASEQVLEILSHDPQACRDMDLFCEAAREEGITGEAYRNYQKTVLAVLIMRNRKALGVMADVAYKELTTKPK